jgi:predicted DNA-binding transcriptional regulator AlpA
MKSEWLTSKEVANRVGLTPSTIKSYKYRDEMPEPDHYFNRTPVWHKDTIDEWDTNRKKLLANRGSKED